MRLPKASGLLCHVTSLPNQFGIGDLGPEVYRFVDFLHAAEQRIWQLLPLGPPAHGNSPYSCYSAFAGNPLLISPSQLVDEGLLKTSDLEKATDLSEDPTRVDYKAVAALKLPLLRKAFDHFRNGADGHLHSKLQTFCAEHAWWLDDFARFETLMLHFGESNWTRWPADLVRRENDALKSWDTRLSEQIEFTKFNQFIFDSQWSRLKQYAGGRGIRMYGDLPIFVAHQSADVWANQSIFELDDSGKPALVAGVPPDYFSKTGQRWGNPLYRWDVLASTGYRWWTDRFRHALRQFDLLRVDHFRGFEAYWEIPASARTAVHGRWVKGPGAKPFDAAREVLGDLPLVAEDLGMITEEVHQLRDQLGFPGMRVLQFGYDTVEDDFHRPPTYPEHSVAYTGTHDNDTLMGWYRKRKIAPKQIDPLREVVTTDTDVHWQLIAEVLKSPADTAVIPVQDLLGLGNDARMNIPGTAEGNWAWRLSGNAMSDEIASRLRDLTRATGRAS